MNAKRTGGRPVGKLVGIALVLFVAGILVGRAWLAPSSPAPGTHEGHEQEEAAEVWTCSMHPQVRLPSPGKCPICRMDLVQVESGAAGEDGDAPRLEMSEAARVLAEIETAPVVRDRPRLEIRMTGKAEVDETRVHALSARVAGRLDRMFVDYTGLPVRAGDHLAEIYSPELLAAQEELLQVVASRGALSGESTGLLSDTATATVEAAREKLRLYGLTEEQIKGIERRGETEDHVTLFADHGGIVIEKNAVVGDYVRTGTTIYRIADLSRLWVVLDAHESDLAWLRSGQEVEFDAESLPGRIFTGRVSFIAPAVEEAS
ncbi:MAG: efflux RND transporter periplasmic adaptor subunit, partial [Gemmatimonadota bacterium]|nr:efflux RND transporter periplasmic adaptor subunit [Gemmatimonadota bacterium]